MEPIREEEGLSLRRILILLGLLLVFYLLTRYPARTPPSPVPSPPATASGRLVAGTPSR